MYAAMAGAAGGAISSVVYGQNIEKGLAYGAIGGLTGMAVAAVTSAAIAFGKSVTEELVAIQACAITDVEAEFAPTRIDIIDLAEFADAWLNDEPITTISPNEWNQLLADTRKLVRGKSKWKLWEAMGMDTEYDNDHRFYYVASLRKFSYGFEINYIGEGMYFNHNWLAGKGHVWAPAWKYSNMVYEFFGGKLNPRREPYKPLTRDERFYLNYGNANFSE